MSTVNSIRTGINAALATLLPTTQRYDALLVEDAFDISKRRPSIVVVYLGRQKATGPLSQTLKNTMRYRWALIFVAENWRDGISSGTEMLDLSDTVDAIRAVEVATIDSEPVRLQFVDDSFQAPPGRPVDGGPAVYITNWVTTEVLA
jgi:hypothetical protein